jgi:hypothetical protein
VTRQPSFDAIVDRCLDDIVQGRATVSECLERWPEHRADLAPMLEAAVGMRAVPRVPARAPDPARRQALMIQIGQLPQDRRRRLIPALPLPRFGGGLAMRLASAAAPVAAVVVIAALLLFSQTATPASAATLTLFEGQAEVFRDGRWQAVADGDHIETGARIRTVAGGYAMLTFDDGSTLSLAPGTELAIELASFREDHPRELVVRLTAGRIWNDVALDLRQGARYEVITPDAVVRGSGPVFETAFQEASTVVTAADGYVELTAGGQSVPVTRGELARTRAGVIAEHRASDVLDEAIIVAAPFAATLFSERGEATGVRTDGTVLRQLAGVTTTIPGPDPQRFNLQGLGEGSYTLLLQRIGEGDGEVIVRTNGRTQRVPVEVDGSARLEIEVTGETGVPWLRLASESVIETDPAAFAFRIVESARTRNAQPLSERPAVTPPQRPDVQPGPRPATTPDAAPTRPAPTPESTPAVDPTRPPQEQPARPQRATPEPPARGLPDFVLRIEAEREAFRRDLRAALASDDEELLAATIEAALDEDDPALLRTRMGVLAQFLDEPRMVAQLRTLFDVDATPGRPGTPPGLERAPGLLNRLEGALEQAGPPASRGRLDRALGPLFAPGRQQGERPIMPEPAEPEEAEATEDRGSLLDSLR